ncbi:MAG: alanine racemase [Clostridia bacterium]|nr:alanine racemase [Clostridia bacterium]
MESYLRRTWADISLDAVEKNYKIIKSRLNDGVKMLCVIKANAYGHGAVRLANIYEELGADWFAVSNLEEALQLRQGGISLPILILGYTDPSAAKLLSDNNVTQAVFSDEYARRLNDFASASNVNVGAHIKIDTGMSRIGFYLHKNEDEDSFRQKISSLKDFRNLDISGAFTHFAVADEQKGKPFVNRQFDMFTLGCGIIKECGFDLRLRHCCNSAGTMCYPEMQLDMVRNGITLYGLAPSDELYDKFGLEQVMSLRSVISLVKTLHKGDTVSYGRTFTADRDMKIATVAIGYADGFPRLASNKYSVLVNGVRCKITGRVCMDQIMIDVTGVDAKAGDTVTIFGCDNGSFIPVDELSSLIGTINYETVCDINGRVARRYIRHGKEIAVDSLL